MDNLCKGPWMESRLALDHADSNKCSWVQVKLPPAPTHPVLPYTLMGPLCFVLSEGKSWHSRISEFSKITSVPATMSCFFLECLDTYLSGPSHSFFLKCLLGKKKTHNNRYWFSWDPIELSVIFHWCKHTSLVSKEDTYFILGRKPWNLNLNFLQIIKKEWDLFQ